MNNSVVVFDDFYDNPREVRKYALNLKYDVIGNYPGFRSGDNDLLSDEEKGNHNLGVKNFMESYFGRNIKNWGNSYNGSFQYVTYKEKTWIHTDYNDSVNYAALIYLHPSPPPGDYGTIFFTHKETGTYLGHPEDSAGDDGNDNSKWSITDYVGYRFNRLVMYDARMWHCANNYFGDTLHDSRLFQCFFFWVEK